MANISITLREYDRNTTKSQYKEISHWLRSCRRIVEPQVTKQLEQAISDLYIYGTAVI